MPPRVRNHVHLMPSILDRLLDDAPGDTTEPPTVRFQTIQQLKDAVTRDLESLLNTRQEAWDGLLLESEELQHSLMAYGLPDFTAYSLLNAHDRQRIRLAIEQTIAAFEPRMLHVRVTLTPPRESDRTLRFSIEALLRLEPAPEPVVFDAILQLNTHNYVVHGRD